MLVPKDLGKQGYSVFFNHPTVVLQVFIVHRAGHYKPLPMTSHLAHGLLILANVMLHFVQSIKHCLQKTRVLFQPFQGRRAE